MAAKIASPRAELAVLRGMCHKKKEIAGTLLGAVDESFFYSPEGTEVFTAVRKLILSSGASPNYKMLLEDPTLSKEARSFLRDSEASIQSVEEAKRAVRMLNKYRQTRGLYDIALSIDKAMQSSKIDVDDLLEECSKKLSAARASKSRKDAFLHFGLNNNSNEFVKDLIFGDHSEDLIPSCIEAFDRESGGFLRGSLVVVGASSGGGKSLLANHFSVNMPLRGFKVLLVPLEMTKAEMTARVLANRSDLDVTKIIAGKLSEGEKERAYLKYQKWAKKIKKMGGRLTVFKPEEDMTFEEVIAASNTYDADVRIFDYISLFKGVDGEDSWQQLGAVARQAKIHAGVTNSLNILLCQVNDEGKIKYARAIAEHANNALLWVAKKEEREKPIGRILAEQPKARNSRSFPLDMGFKWAAMKVVPVDQVSPDVGDSATPMQNLADV